MSNQQIENKQIGLWMDHTEARFMKPGSQPNEIITIHSVFNGRVRIDGESGDGTRLGNYRSTNNESHKHFRAQNEVHDYFKQLAEQLEPYQEIYIFGPTTAPDEFHNYLRNEKKISGKRISVEKVDYITENQMLEKVRDFFETANHKVE